MEALRCAQLDTNDRQNLIRLWDRASIAYRLKRMSLTDEECAASAPLPVNNVRELWLHDGCCAQLVKRSTFRKWSSTFKFCIIFLTQREWLGWGASPEEPAARQIGAAHGPGEGALFGEFALLLLTCCLSPIVLCGATSDAADSLVGIHLLAA